MADPEIPPSAGKRQSSTAEPEIDAKKMKRVELEPERRKRVLGESKEEREKKVKEMIRKFRAEYKEDEDDLEVLRDLVGKYKVEYGCEGIWDDLVEYILDNLPVIKNQDGSDSDDEALNYTGEDLKLARLNLLSKKLYPVPDKVKDVYDDLDSDDLDSDDLYREWSPGPLPLSVTRNNPLPEGYEWRSCDSFNPYRKDYIHRRLPCFFCSSKAHDALDCPQQDELSHPRLIYDYL